MTTKIALSMRITNADGYDEPRDSLSHDWFRLLIGWGFLPVCIPNAVAEAARYMDALSPDLLVLTGGDDLGDNPLRDATETALLEYACGRGLPVLGVCRGLQLINVHFGGQLTPVDGHVATPHKIIPSQAWSGLYESAPVVNSFHAKGIEAGGLADDLIVGAIDDRGAVEAAHHDTLPIAGVMWHPERYGAPQGDRSLFAALMDGGILHP